MIEIATFCKQGKNKLNQDAILHIESKNNIILFAIADGMGGEDGGNFASNYILNIVQELFVENDQIEIVDIFNKASEEIKKISENIQKYSKMATTLTICIIQNNIAKVGHVGDCRIYHLRNDGIMSRTTDQTELQKLLDEKILTKQLAKNYHRKNILLSVMSGYSNYELQQNSFEVIENDRLLLLSDGVYNVLSSKIYFRDLSLESQNVKILADKIQKDIENRKIIDDYSCICVEI